jgi:diguanylate cyclase (GGDEF)-like protein
MQTTSQPTGLIEKYGRYLFLAWTVIVLVSIGYNIRLLHQDILKESALEAKTYYELNMYYRVVLAQFGGIYVPIDKTPPNPYLPVLNRDIATTDGKQFTLVNPAYMTRIVFDTIKSKSKLPVINKITSLKSLNPANNPDAWEKNALLSFEKGQEEASEVTLIDGRPYLRLIKPFITEEGCLKCHGHQGYKPGDIRGGISIAVPLQPYYEAEKQTRKATVATHGILWLVVSLGLLLFTRMTVKNTRTYEETRILALYDPLTRLANRRLLDIEFEKSFAKAKRYGNKLSAIMADIDHFKEYNDAHGHEAGDVVLTKIAGIVLAGIRETDLAVRYGGEEFFILLPQTSVAEAWEMAERIRKSVEEGAGLTVSLGISAFRDKMKDREEIIREADDALYRAKQNGRNRVEVMQ